MKKTITVLVALAFAGLSGLSIAQTAAPAESPTVQSAPTGGAEAKPKAKAKKAKAKRSKAKAKAR
jgi:hypothetical protein